MSRAAGMRPGRSCVRRHPASCVHALPGDPDREIARARKNRARLQPVEPADRMAEMRGVGIADILRQMREIEILVGEMQQMARAFPGTEGAERDAGLLLEQMQEARRG